MSVRPKHGEQVQFTASPGHLVPQIGRPGQFYAAGTTYAERWSPEHDARLRSGAIVLAPAPDSSAADDHNNSGEEP